MFAHYLLLLMTTSKRKESVGVASPMSLHIFHLSQWVYSQKAKLLYLDLVAVYLNSFAAKQNTELSSVEKGRNMSNSSLLCRLQVKYSPPISLLD